MKALRKLNPRPHTLKNCKLRSNHPLSSMILSLIFLYICVNIQFDILTKKNEQSTLRRETTRARPRPTGRVGRDEQGEAHRANTAPNGGPHLELGRLRLPGLNLTSRLLRLHGQHIYTCIYTKRVPGYVF